MNELSFIGMFDSYGRKRQYSKYHSSTNKKPTWIFKKPFLGRIAINNTEIVRELRRFKIWKIKRGLWVVFQAGRETERLVLRRLLALANRRLMNKPDLGSPVSHARQMKRWTNTTKFCTILSKETRAVSRCTPFMRRICADTAAME